MTISDVRLLWRWAFWLAMLTLATLVLLWTRPEIDQSHVALTLLLVVLGGSAGGGRPLGFALAVIGFVLIDYLFQPPYELLSVGKPLDWVVLVAFVASAFVATELLTRAREEAEVARRRAEEIASLARIGSETLRYARPEDALAAVANLVRGTIGAQRVTILVSNPGGTPWRLTAPDEAGDPDADARVAALLENDQPTDDHTSRIAAIEPGGATLRGSIDAATDAQPMLALAVPLVVETRRVGVLVIGAGAAPLALDGAQRRFLAAIGHYAALGAERLRLSAEAEHAHALREENRTKDEVLAAVSHDLRTPLTTIKLLAQSAAARGEATAAVIEEQTDRLSQMVTNVLDLSRIRAGGVTLDLELNTAEDLIGAAISAAAGIVGNRIIETSLDLSDPPLAGRFDFVQSLRIVSNLLDNALRYTSDGKPVSIGSAREGGHLVIRVADGGPGVKSDDRERIFEPFYRSSSRNADVGHVGLGLSIARRLAELQGGTVEYEPRPGGGSIFSLRLAVADSSTLLLTGDDTELSGATPR